MENPQPVTTERIFYAYLKVARVAESTERYFISQNR